MSAGAQVVLEVKMFELLVVVPDYSTCSSLFVAAAAAAELRQEGSCFQL